MSVDSDTSSTVDPNRLVGVGGQWRAAVCITADGSETYWLLSPTPTGDPGCACPACAPHEQLDQARQANPA